MPPKKPYTELPKKTELSSSGKVQYAITNFVALLEKGSVHADFHPLVDFLKNSPISYALTASPSIYAEIVHEMWSTADCSSTRGEIKFTIKGNSCIITPSVINKALHFPESNFENTPTQVEIISMLKAINYAGKLSLSQILRKKFRKEWSYFFDTLNKCFAGKCSSYDTINTFVLKIAYSLLYGKRIDFGKLLLDEFCYKFGDVQHRDRTIYYARFLMIIANYLCKDVFIEDRNDTLQVHMQTKKLFAGLVRKNLNAEVEFVLPEHVQLQLSTLYSALSHTSSLQLPPTMEDVREGYTSPTQVALPSPFQSGTVATSSVSQSSAVKRKRSKRKRTTFPPVETRNGVPAAAEVHLPRRKEDAIDQEMPPAETRDGVPAAAEVHLPRRKEDASNVSSVSVVAQEMLPAETRVDVPALELPSSPEEETPIRDLPEPPLEPDQRQQLLNAASVLKSLLVARLTSSGNKLSTKEMTILAKKEYRTLEGLRDEDATFRTRVDQLISQHRRLEIFAEEKESSNEQDIRARHDQQVQCLSEVTQKLHSAEDQVHTAKTKADSLKLKREELTSAILKLTEELSEVDETIKTLNAERDQCKEAHSVAEVELCKLGAEKEKARERYREIEDKHNAASEELERMSTDLLQLVGR